MRLEVDLDEFAGCVAAYHDVEEGLVVGRLKESRVVDEGDVDPAGVIGVGMDEAPVARWSFSLRRGEFSSSKRFSRFHQAT